MVYYIKTAKCNVPEHKQFMEARLYMYKPAASIYSDSAATRPVSFNPNIPLCATASLCLTQMGAPVYTLRQQISASHKAPLKHYVAPVQGPGERIHFVCYIKHPTSNLYVLIVASETLQEEKRSAYSRCFWSLRMQILANTHVIKAY